ncbi:sodium:solute symporter family protein [uncultured Ferrovibrio sp.]|jgi:cation/acetate symporter|uniref:sodium:solute symporter family protein n=1 Tax=uncultured Ferrovibrio sp. TaxID=1576913 RepID=UPI00262E57DC|nr:sodium:solute symporter family protein [uncultured Ferrovibrio sp.]
MANNTKDGGFIANLGKIYGMYTGGFVAFVIVLAILEQLGVSNQVIGYLFVFLTIGVYALIGILSRTAEMGEYYVAGRKVPALYNGMATGSDWMSAASFIGMAGTLYLSGYDGLAFVLGWTGGYLLVSILLAPYLRKFGQFTVPDFLGARYGGNVARFVGVIVLISASFAYVTAQIFGVGIIASRFLGISFEIAVFVGLAGILVCSMLGGMRAVTWTQVAQYIILIIAYLIPVIILSAKVTGVPIPQLMYGQAIEKIQALEPTLGVVKGHTATFANAKGEMNFTDGLNFFALIFCLMVGTAALPHILMRYFTTPSVRDARKSVAWSLFFIFLLYFTAPSYAAFAKLEVYQNVIGTSIDQLPAWVQSWGEIGLVGTCDRPDAAVRYALCQGVTGNNDGILQLSEFRIHTDAIVLATPEIAGLPYVIAGLVAAGGLAAALSTADGLLLAIANALSHDIYYRMIDPHAPTKRRLILSRVLLVGVAIVAAFTAAQKPSTILAMVAWAFSIAASGLFPALVMGIWWKRTSNAGAIAGMIAGYGVCVFYLVMTQFYGMPLWFGVKNISCGLFGIPAAFIVTYVVSLMTPAPSKEMQDFIDSIRIPKGEVKLARAEDAIAH